ncbi:hypothetical protein BGZ82_008734 [Podila clonocystis]|nr:hypothetical protein BGZ82_008734 [Podila clonocystis]
MFISTEDLCQGLCVDPTVGLCSDEDEECSIGNTGSVKFADRKGAFGNRLSSNKMHLFARLLRDGREQQLHVKEILVGDIQLVGPGDILAVDGIILKNDKLVSEEPIAICCIKPKTKGPQCRYVIAGSKVLSGAGSVVVTAVGSEVYLVRMNRRECLEPEHMWMCRTLFNFGLSGVVSGFLICAITWISMLPFTIERPYDVSELYYEERENNADIASILYQTMRVVSVIAFISVRDAFLLAVVGSLLYIYHGYNPGHDIPATAFDMFQTVDCFFVAKLLK